MGGVTTEPRPRGSKGERVEARVNREQKLLLQRAAALQGRSLSDFIISSAQETAARVIQEHEIITLSVKDREAFVEALLEPPKPSQSLRAAAQRYKERRGE